MRAQLSTPDHNGRDNYGSAHPSTATAAATMHGARIHEPAPSRFPHETVVWAVAGPVAV